MRLSLEWLLDLVKLPTEDPVTIANALTNCGLEIEGAIEQIGPQFKNVVVGQIETIEAHPNADKLRLATVNLGPLGMAQVVCGAPNIAVDQRIAYAQLNATVYSPKQDKWFTLSPATIRGVESKGMICSISELALEHHYPDAVNEQGIWPITEFTSEPDLGRPLTEVLGLKSDAVLHSAPTANRGDHMAYLGVARELAALFKTSVIPPTVLDINFEHLPPASFALSDVDSELCPYYSLTVLSNIKVAPSPEWLSQRLVAAGIRPINNVVDITNYVMLETGQPMHAFDVNKLTENKAAFEGVLGVRRASPQETLVTLDEQQRNLSEDSIVITYNNKPVALAGVMGGLSSAIDEQTTTVALEIAFFPSMTTRRSARSVGLRSDSSARYERGVDPAGGPAALNRALLLLQEVTSAQLMSYKVTGSALAEQREIPLRLERIQTFIGQAYSKENIVHTLESLGFKLTRENDSVLNWAVPSFRLMDVFEETDLIEEVLRIQGFDNVPATLPSQAISAGTSRRQSRIKLLHNTLRGLGLQEVSTASLIGPSWSEAWGFPLDSASAVKLINSHSQDHTHMRQALAPNLLEVLKENLAKDQQSVWIYELGKVYNRRGKPGTAFSGVLESLHLGLAVYGQASPISWHTERNTDFYTLKGLLEKSLATLGIGSGYSTQQGRLKLVFSPTSEYEALHPGRQASIYLQCDKQEKAIGWIGEWHPGLAANYRWKQIAYLAEIDIDLLLKQLLQSITNQITSSAPSPYPPTERDMALLVPDSVSYQSLLDVIEHEKNPLLQQVALFDEYKGHHLPEGHRSLALRFILQSREQTLTDAEADQIINQLRGKLEQELGLSLR